MEQISDKPRTLREVYQRVAELLMQPEWQGQSNVLVQFDGFAPSTSDLTDSIQEIFPSFSEAGGFHWSVPSDKPTNGNNVPHIFREHPVPFLPKDEGFIHVFLVFVRKIEGH